MTKYRHPEWATADMFRVGETWKTKPSTQTWLITEITPEGKVRGKMGKSGTVNGLNLDRSDWMLVSVGDTPKVYKGKVKAKPDKLVITYLKRRERPDKVVNSHSKQEVRHKAGQEDLYWNAYKIGGYDAQNT